MARSRTSLVIRTVILTILVMVVLVIIAGLVAIYTGIPNVAATSPHGTIVSWILSTTADRSVEVAARNVKVPPDYDQINIRAGYYDYDSMCVMCHGAPGVDRQWVGEGLYPKPPHLYVSVKDMSPAEVFWIIRNGLKDTGMPALTVTHPDSQIWRIAALVKKLPEMTPEEYKTLGQGSAGTGAVPGATGAGVGQPEPNEGQPGVHGGQGTGSPAPPSGSPSP
jgi:mono/diheme cytochrome c family protein